MFSLCFDIFIHSLTISQPVAALAPMLANNIPVLIQPCCLCCVHQIACFTDICNVTNVHWCDYCCLLNKLCYPVSSMQDVRELLISKRFHLTLTLLPTAFCVNTVMSTTRLWPKVTTTALLYFMMQHRGPSPVSFKLTKSSLWNAVRLHLQHICISQL